MKRIATLLLPLFWLSSALAAPTSHTSFPLPLPPGSTTLASQIKAASPTDAHASTATELNGNIGNIAGLRAMHNSDNFIYLQGYYRVGDGGEGFLTVVAGDSSADNGCTIFVDAGGHRWHRGSEHAISVKQCGAYGDNLHNDMVPFRSWWSALMTQGGGAGMIPPGHYKLTGGSLVLDFAASAVNGVHISGAGPRDSVIDLSSDVSANFQIVNSANSDFYFGIFDNLQVITDYAGPGVLLGQNNFADTLNGFAFRDIVINNTNASNSAIGLKLNAVSSSSFSNVTVSGACTDVHGNCGHSGEAIELDRAISNTMNFSAGHATIALRLTQGYNFANVFNALDLENVTSDVVIDSVNTKGNTWVGGTFVNYHSFNAAAANSYAVAGLSGASNIFENPNMDTANMALNADAVQINSTRYGMTTPAFPLSGNAVINTSGRRVQVVISGGNVTGICYGPTVTTCQAQNNINTGFITLTLMPGDGISLIYTGNVVWGWEPVS
jgi:hypothetical protein